jgi:tetratricopeptide (TPR) repeat protein
MEGGIKMGRKKWLIPGFILLAILGVVIYVVIWISIPSDLPISAKDNSPCAQWGIAFDSTSVDWIYDDPGSILDDPTSFWKEDPAYSLVALAPWYKDMSIPPSGWVKHVEKVHSVPAQDRDEESAFARSVEIMDYADIYCGNAIPVITSVLPQNANVETKVYLSAFNDPEGFALRSNIVMNAGSKSYFGKTSKFFNILSHEIFHIGYFNHQPHQTEIWPDNYPLHVILVTLQNDGMAVFLQHELHTLYLAPAEIELFLLDKEIAVKVLMGRVNRLLQDAGTLDEDESMKQAFSGLNQTALYVVGAHMAWTIDEKLGREALAQTVSIGPRSFIHTYNSVAEEGMKVHEVEEPIDLSPIQTLRKAAVEEDYAKLEIILEEIGEEGILNPGGIAFENLMSAGLVLLSQDRHDLALEAFELLVALFPDYPFSHVYLGDAYVEMGEMELAEEAYLKAIKLDSWFSSVVPEFAHSAGSE